MGVSFTCTKDSQNSRGSEESILISLYQFHLHTKIKTFIYIYGFDVYMRPEVNSNRFHGSQVNVLLLRVFNCSVCFVIIGLPLD